MAVGRGALGESKRSGEQQQDGSAEDQFSPRKRAAHTARSDAVVVVLRQSVMVPLGAGMTVAADAGGAFGTAV